MLVGYLVFESDGFYKILHAAGSFRTIFEKLESQSN